MQNKILIYSFDMIIFLSVFNFSWLCKVLISCVSIETLIELYLLKLINMYIKYAIDILIFIMSDKT